VDLKEILKRLRLSEQNISMVLGALVVVVIGVLIFNYFRGVGKKEEAPQVTPTPAEIQLVEEEGKLVPEGLPRTHKVEEGEHLWNIAEKYYGSGYNWVDISQENGLANPDMLLVGQELTIPKTEVRKPVEPVVAQAITGNSYTVEKNDSLWHIAVRAYGDGYQWTKIWQANEDGYQWTKIWQANEDQVEDPNIIETDQVLTIPR
jgi:nucleoid-associated protein YgaU